MPGELGRLTSDVAVAVEHRPGPPGLPGLCPAVPLAGGTTGYAGEPLDRIAFYREAVCASRRTGQEIREQDRRTAIHEAARRFGTDDGRLSELGWQSSSFHCVPRQPARSRTADLVDRRLSPINAGAAPGLDVVGAV